MAVARVCNSFKKFILTCNHGFTRAIYTVSQRNVPLILCNNFDTHEQILTFFGRNVTDKVGNQKVL